VKISAKDDIIAIEKIVLDWRRIDTHLNIDKDVLEELGANMDIIGDEIAKSNPLKNTICDALKVFKKLYHKNVLMDSRLSGYSSIHPDLMVAMDKFEGSLQDDFEGEYYAEAKKCLAHQLYRPFIVSSWNVVMYRLFRLIEKDGLKKFETAYNKGNGRPVCLNSLEDFYDINDYRVIDLAGSNSGGPKILDKHQKEILFDNLKIRNKCAHVSTCFRPKEGTVLKYVDEVVDSFLTKS
jgi:hypothetical protein